MQERRNFVCVILISLFSIKFNSSIMQVLIRLERMRSLVSILGATDYVIYV